MPRRATLTWQTNWDSFNQGANDERQQAQVERTRINHPNSRKCS